MAYGKMKKEARKKMLKELKGMMKDDAYGHMKDKMKSMDKVTVASDSPEGLQEGLSKAQKILKKRSEMEGEEYEGGGVKARTTEAPDSLGKGDAEYRGYTEDPDIMKKKPKYWSYRKMHPKLMKDQYKDGGYKKDDKYKEKMKALKKYKMKK